MLAYFFLALGIILLACAFIVLAARALDRYDDWKDWDTDRREARRKIARQHYWDRVCEDAADEWATLP